MASLAKTNTVIGQIFNVFTPTGIKITYKDEQVKTPPMLSQRFNTRDEKGKKKLFQFLFNRGLSHVEVTEVQIVTTAGTIRESSTKYDRTPRSIVQYMGMRIDILGCSKDATELQLVTLTDGHLARCSPKNVKPLDLTELRKVWNDNPERYRIPMPCPTTTYIQTKYYRNYI